MFEYFKNNPWKTITGIISVITALSGVGYGAYTTSSDVLDTLASKTYVKEQVTDLSLNIIDINIMRYETELMNIDFLIETGKSKPIDNFNKKNIKRNLRTLRDKRAQFQHDKKQ